jgi:hypothetical protein
MARYLFFAMGLLSFTAMDGICLGGENKLKSGFDIVKPTQKELENRAKNLTKANKKNLHFKQLVEILPKEIIDNVSCRVLTDIGFSVQDDDLLRAKKYERLALLLINSKEVKDFDLRRELIFCCFYQSFCHLSTIEVYSKLDCNVDYYLSTAQVAFWAARAKKKCSSYDREEVDGLIGYSQYYLKKASQKLEDTLSGEDISSALLFIEKAVRESVLKTPTESIPLLASDSLTYILLSETTLESSLYKEYLDKRVSVARGKISKNIPSSVVSNAMSKYKDKLSKQIEEELLSEQEKVNYILQQDALELYRRLKNLGLLSNDVAIGVETKGLLEKYRLYLQFAFLLKSRNIIPSEYGKEIRKVYLHSFVKLNNSLKNIK